MKMIAQPGRADIRTVSPGKPVAIEPASDDLLVLVSATGPVQVLDAAGETHELSAGRMSAFRGPVTAVAREREAAVWVRAGRRVVA